MTVLRNVHIPRALRGFESEARLFDVALAAGRVAAVRAAQDGPCEGTLISAMADAHVHIDKTFTIGETGAVNGDLFAAIGKMAEHRALWSARVIRERMDRALEDAWRSGTRAMRTHLDWPEAGAPPALMAFEAARKAWTGRVELQFVSLTPLDLFADEVVGEVIAAEVARAGGVLGAFIYRNEGLEKKLERVFHLAGKHGLQLDFHVDEGLHADAHGLAEVAKLTLRNARHGRVVCGHCCSLSVQPASRAMDTLALCAVAGIHIVSLPTTNLYLQGAWDQTPLERGVTRLKEARDLHVRTSLATDNVADAFYPYGSYDLFETFGLGVQAAHLAPPGDWLDAITVNPALAMGLPWDGRIRDGCPGDVVLLAARNDHELLTPAGRRRTVYRDGLPI
jgi:cytosine/creatinine deaminase